MADLKDLRRLAVQQGWQVTRSGSGHWRFVSPDGALVIGGNSPGDHRAGRNLRANLKRVGLVLPRKDGRR